MKVGKELKLNLLNNYKTKIGTVNNKESKSLYINLSAWGEINNIDENTNYESVLRNLRKKIKQNLNNKLNEEIFHNNKYIVDLDMRSSGFVTTKRSFMSCEITLYQKKGLPINQIKLLNESKKLIYDVANNCLIGGGCTIGAGTKIANNTFIGVGCTIASRNLKIGSSCFISSGSILFNSIQSKTKIIGNPARKIL